MELKTSHICLAALRQKGYEAYKALQYVPDNLKTAELCLEALKQDKSGELLEYVPENIKSLEFWHEAVKIAGHFLSFVDPLIISVELCHEAVRFHGEALSDVPKELKTEQMCLDAVKLNGRALKYVPEEFKTEQMCLEAVQISTHPFQYVPENLKTAEIYNKITRNDIRMFRFVPDSLKTKEMCMLAVGQYEKALRFVPEKFKTAELCMEAVKHYGKMLWYVPENLRTTDLCLEAVRQYGKALNFVPEKLKTPELCMAAIESDGSSFKFVPEKLKTMELCLEAAKNINREMLEYVPPEFITEINKHVFWFENVVVLDDKATQLWLSEADSIDVAMALRGSDIEVQNKIFKNMAEQDAKMLEEDMEYMGPIRIRDVIKARKKICSIISRLEETGKIVIPRAEEDEMTVQKAKRPGDIDHITSSLNADYIVEILNLVDADSKMHIMDVLEEENPELAYDVKKCMFVFKDIILLDDRYIQRILHEVDSLELCTALKSVEIEVQEKIFRNLAKHFADMLKKDIENIGMIGMKDIKDAQQKILSTIHYLEEMGVIDFPRISRDELAV
jgi:flagellar motor switch protein FliG